jgi:nucleoid-associated protein YgaU
MGIFSFIKTAGKAMLEKSTLENKHKKRTKEALKLRQEGMLEGLIYNAGLKIKHLDVEIKGGKVTVFGETDKAEDREKAILILGNVAGITEVDDRISLTAGPQKPRFYEVQKGDTLSGIARQFYGDPLKYDVLFEANRQVIEDPNLIYPGQKIRVPEIS